MAVPSSGESGSLKRGSRMLKSYSGITVWSLGPRYAFSPDIPHLDAVRHPVWPAETRLTRTLHQFAEEASLWILVADHSHLSKHPDCSARLLKLSALAARWVHRLRYILPAIRHLRQQTVQDFNVRSSVSG